jgi:protein pelota
MQILKRNLKEGRATVKPETLDDLWHLEKVIDPGDLVKSKTTRKFVTEAGKTDRKPVTIALRTESVEFHKYSNKLRLLGKIEYGFPEEYVSMGSHHTIEAEPNHILTIQKERGWKNYQLARLDEAVKASKKPKLIIAVMDDEATEMASLQEYGLESKGKISSGRQGKDYETKTDVKQQYFHEVADTLESFKCDKIVVAGAGFTKDDFSKFCSEKYPKLKPKLIFEDIGSPGHSGMQEVLRGGSIENIYEDARAAVETKLIDKVLAETGRGSGLSTYGIKEVEEALDYGAVHTLLVAESLFLKKRKQIEKLLEKADAIKAEIHIVSTEHDAGKQLKSLGGIAALQRFKIT